MNNINGLAKLDDSIISKRPPKIKWGVDFESWGEDRQIEYLKKLAATMNNAADLIQTERNGLLSKCATQEAQIIGLQRQNQEMQKNMHDVIIQTNEERQMFNQKVAELNASIKDLEY